MVSMIIKENCKAKASRAGINIDIGQLWENSRVEEVIKSSYIFQKQGF